MSIDRYLYIVRPKSKLAWRTPRNAWIICIAVWIGEFQGFSPFSSTALFHVGSLILIVPYHIVSHALTSGSGICGMNAHENFIICFSRFCSYYAIPLIIIIVCYTNLALHVVKSGRQMVDHIEAVGYC